MPAYTHGHHESVLRSHRWRTAENSAGHLLGHLRPGQRLLDVGCGPGTITADLAERVGPTGSVVAGDTSEEVLRAAERVCAERGLTNVAFRVLDTHALDLPDDSFDVVHAHQVLQHVHDPVLALREMRRVCVPGGVVAVRDADYRGFTWYPQLPELDAWLDLYQVCARANGGEPDAGRRLLSWARAAGFTEVTPGASTWCHADEADRAYWGGMWADRVLESALAEQAVRDGHATAQELQRLSDGWRRWAADPDGWLVVLHGEILCVA
ncbi:methyltransferase domain-containing protein [Streptomyces sp. SL13]|uniref:Methyltransferase domain-containing protein n=1 Tax=Streptantibioticus silvisoli TaxID=2705255 RepID=A0AA90GXB9_9ACTN|nr:methyltransferase domain-containing protein [Streptantibioticus silvisoli]MDI5967226.1 methyltransferase domain-containing protein [Streptantibioticus silvisoli]MDI5969843.1 methyltransferase domain-containing protein [Streptantibioticus silvisoli]